MTYFIIPFHFEVTEFIFESVKSPHKVIILPQLHDSLQRRFAHALWHINIFVRWRLYDKAFYDQLDGIKEEDIVIFFSVYFKEPILNILPYLPNRSNIRVFFWDSVNLVDKNIGGAYKLVSILKKLNLLITTFDKKDSKTFELNWLPQFYRFGSVPNKVIGKSLDFYFCGVGGRDRLLVLNNLERIFKSSGFIFKFDVVTDGLGVSYKTIIENIHKSRCIVEINREGQQGLTLRAMEALAFRTKLITTNLDIKNYDFYREENVYMLGSDDRSIASFMQIPYKVLDENILRMYDVNTWLANLEKHT